MRIWMYQISRFFNDFHTEDIYDFSLLKELDAYTGTNKLIADAAGKCLSGHLWYLSETLFAYHYLAIF